MKREHPGSSKLAFLQLGVALSFYNVPAEIPREGFEQVAARVLPCGFGKPGTAAACKREARKMYDLAKR
jgi:hypothetical protein